MVLVWDLLNAQNQAAVPNAGGAVNGSSSNGAGAGGAAAGDVQGKGPLASWRCEYEVANVSWAPSSALTGGGSDWLGVSAGRGVWGVKL
jgi:DDB1- and CUL4-associated factor 7